MTSIKWPTRLSADASNLAEPNHGRCRRLALCSSAHQAAWQGCRLRCRSAGRRDAQRRRPGGLLYLDHNWTSDRRATSADAARGRGGELKPRAIDVDRLHDLEAVGAETTYVFDRRNDRPWEMPFRPKVQNGDI